MAARTVHPFVTETLSIADQVVERLLSAQEAIEKEKVGLQNKDGDIAVQVDHCGVLVSFWLKPGTIGRRSAEELTKEVTALIRAASDQARTASLAALQAARADCAELAEKLPTLDVNNPYVPEGLIPARTG